MNQKPEKTEASNKFDHPEFLLLLVILIMLWSVGFVDIISQAKVSEFGAWLYGDRRVTMLLLLYCALLLPWLWAVFAPNSHHYLGRLLSWLQNHNWTAILMLLGAIGLFVNLLRWPFWFRFAGFSTVLMIALLLLTAVFLFVRPQSESKSMWWRKLALFGFGAVMLIELIAQGLAYTGSLPGDVHWDGGYVKHGRIYHNLEGLGNGRANSNGWYANEFELAEDTTKIGLIGDTFIQALQVDPNDNLAVQLNEQIDAADVEVLPLGHTGLGPSVYMHPSIIRSAINTYGVQEIVVYIHLSNDLRNLTAPNAPDLSYTYDEDGKVVIHPDQFRDWHDAAHYALNAKEPLHPIRIAKSYLMSPHLLRSISGRSDDVYVQDANNRQAIPSVRGVIVQTGRADGDHNPVEMMRLVDTTGQSDFLFETAGNEQVEEAFAFAESFIETAHTVTNENNVALKIVTIPAFSPAFYDTYVGQEWSAIIGDYDLFLPERRLQAFANQLGIPFLAMGQYMSENVATTQEISTLFFSEGTGHLTLEGHAFFATATNECFYSIKTTTGCFR